MTFKQFFYEAKVGDYDDGYPEDPVDQPQDEFSKALGDLMAKQKYFFDHPEEFPAPPENEISKQFQKGDLVKLQINAADIPDRWEGYSEIDKLPKAGAVGEVIGKRADGPTADEVQVLVDFTKGTGDPISIPASTVKVVYRP